MPEKKIKICVGNVNSPIGHFVECIEAATETVDVLIPTYREAWMDQTPNSKTITFVDPEKLILALKTKYGVL